MNFIIKIIAIYITVATVFTATTAFAGSTALSPTKFVVAGEANGIISRTVTIRNLSQTRTSYDFYPEDSQAQQLSIVPGQFVLEPEQSAQAVVRIRPGKESWRADLNLVAYSASQMNNNFRVGDGIKIPVFFNAPQVLGASVEITGVTLYFWLLTLFSFGLALAAGSIVCYLYYRHAFWRQIRARHRIN
ncbi:MAG: hypothetical protein AAB779_00360, partial [Patescibacteria group bacterium]